MKTLKFLLQTIIFITPIAYSAYTRSWETLILIVWATLGAFLMALHYESEKRK